MSVGTMATATMNEENNGPSKTNMLLFVLLIAIAAVAVIFVDKMHFHYKTADPRLWLGVETVELTPDIKRQYDIQSTSGLLVARTFRGSPAQVAGIAEGDVMRRWNGTSIISQAQLQYLIQTSSLNKKIKITVDRNNTSVLIYSYVGIRPGGV